MNNLVIDNEERELTKLIASLNAPEILDEAKVFTDFAVVNKDVIGLGFRQMSEAEADRETCSYLRKEAEIAAAESARLRSATDIPEPIQSDGADETEFVLSPKGRALRDKVRAALFPRKSVEPAVVVTMHVKMEEPTCPTVPTDAHIGSVKSEIDATSLPVEITPRTESSAFPISDVASIKEYDDPLRAMAELCKQMLMHKDYALVRDDYCHLSLRLNLIGKLAPGWRPDLKAGRAFGNKIHHAVNRDQVVIDLHWCHATKMPLMPKEPGHIALFGDDANFQFDLAWSLTGKVWTNEFRAMEALCLTPFQQCQLLKLRGAEVADRLKGVGDGWRASGGKSASKIAAVCSQIMQWAERDKRILPQRESYLKLWLAREALGRDAPKQQIADLHALMMGRDVEDRTSIRDKLNSLDKHVTTV